MSIEDQLLRISRLVDPLWLDGLGIQSQLEAILSDSSLRSSLDHAISRLAENRNQIEGCVRNMSLAIPSYEQLSDFHQLNMSVLTTAIAARTDLEELLQPLVSAVEQVAMNQIQTANELIEGLISGLTSQILRHSTFAELLLVRFQLEDIAKRIDSPSHIITALKSAHTSSLSAYTDFYATEADLVAAGGGLSSLAVLPSDSLLLHADVLEQISVDERDSDLAGEREEYISQLEEEFGLSVQTLLAGIDSRLPQLLAGTENALDSTSSDRIRHVSISGRELVTHVLQKLASDDEVGNWSAEPKFFHNGRPTRRARIKYITRHQDSPNITNFIEKDLEALLALLSVLHEGTHSLSAEDIEIFLPSLVLRLKVAIDLLLKASSDTGKPVDSS